MKRLLRNLFGVMLLSLAIAATQIPVEMTEAANDLSEFQLDGTTLVKYTGTAYAVSVPSGVEIIGEEAFSGNYHVKLVRLPKSLESIEYGAFSYCSSLTKIQIPDTVSSIGSGAFACCPKLTSVEIGSGVKEIGTGVFAGCTALKNISIDRGNENFLMDKGVLYDQELTTVYQYCPGRTDSVYTMPASVENIGKYAFWGCQNLEVVALNTDIKEISGYAFSNCRSLQEIMIPYSVHTIGAKAFEDCISLKEVTLLPSLRNIHETAFDGCINLTLYGEDGSIAGNYAKDFNQREKAVQAEYEDVLETKKPSADTDVNTSGADIDNLKEDADVSEEHAQSSMEELGNLLGSTTIVGNQAVVFIDNSAGHVIDGGIIKETQEESMSDNTTTVIDVEKKEDEESIKEMQIPDESSRYDGKGISIPKYTWTQNGSIADQAYYKKKGLTSFMIPTGTKEIGDFAFARSGLTSITIPEGVTRIGYGAFYHCDKLNQVNLPSTIEEIEPEAFGKTGFIENWKKSGSGTFLTAGDGILLAYNGNESTVNVPESVRIIAPGVFANRPEITTVVLPDTLETIGEGAFENCSRLKQVSGGANLLRIQDRAFAGAPLETIRISDHVKEIGLLAFDLEGTNKRNDESVAVFHGGVPIVTYEKTAQRLSNDEYRGMALNKVSYAVIDKDIRLEALKDTVLDASQYGFKGVIISIDSETDMTAIVRGTTLTGEELKDFEVSETVEIFGRQYLISGNEQLESYANQNISKAYNNDGSVLVLNRVENLDTSQISAKLSENEDSFYLSIGQSDDSKKRITDAFKAVYDMDPPGNLTTYEITLLEEKSGVEITKLGKQNLHITMPVPSGLQSGTLFILCSDANGQLEDVPYWYEESESGKKVTFETNHFSDFGFYSSGTTLYTEGIVSQGKVVIGNYSRKDDSPNTGDFLHPKWFLATGLLFAALAVFFYKKKPQKQY